MRKIEDTDEVLPATAKACEDSLNGMADSSLKSNVSQMAQTYGRENSGLKNARTRLEKYAGKFVGSKIPAS